MTLVEDSQKITSDIKNLNQQVSLSKEKTNVMTGLIQNISNLLKGIVKISDQTNLLALNATTEASRAWEAGKGFAVVANEVKELSKMTKKAAEDISEAIHDINLQSTEVSQNMDKSNHLCADGE